MSQKKMMEAEYLFKMNIRNYPTSFNVYDSMGDFHLSMGEKEKAVENYKKALSIKESTDTRNKLNSVLVDLKSLQKD
jgi:predicted negative regulator of RcsB-dependent stress response